MQEEKYSVSVNGFTLENARTVYGPDGKLFRSDLLYRGEKICEYFDEGDGKPYLAYPVNGYTAERIEKAVSAFTKDIGALVDELQDRSCVLDSYRKAARKNKVLVWMRSEESSINIMAPADRDLTDDEAIAKLRGDVRRMHPEISDAVFRVIRSERDLDVNNTEVRL